MSPAVIIYDAPELVSIASDLLPLPVTPGQIEPEVRCFVRRSTADDPNDPPPIIDEFRQVEWTSPLKWVRNGVGECVVRVSLTDPGIGAVVENGVPKTWLLDDIELVVYRRGIRIWAGPIVAMRHVMGFLEIRAWTQEGYVQRTPIGQPDRTNFIQQGYFDNYPNLTNWDFSPGINAYTIDAPATRLWRRDKSVRVISTGFNQSIDGLGDLPDTDRRNVADVALAVMLEPGVTVDSLAYGGLIAQVVHYVAPLASSSFFDVGSYPLLLPEDYVPGTWQRIIQRVPQLANVRNRYRVELYGAPFPGAVFGEVELLYPENVSARAGQDAGLVISSLYQHLLELLPPGWGRINEEVGYILEQAVKYELSNHEDAVSILGEWLQYGDWWVTERILRFGLRGSLIETITLTPENLAEWETNWDDGDGTTELIAQALDQEGPSREEAAARLAGSIYRLATIVQAPQGLSVRDLQAWVIKAFNEYRRNVTIAGTPIGNDVSMPGEMLFEIGLADYIEIHIVDDPLDYTLLAVVSEINYTPINDRMVPTWEILAIGEAQPVDDDLPDSAPTVTSLVGTSGDGEVVLEWDEDDGGSPIGSYAIAWYIDDVEEGSVLLDDSEIGPGPSYTVTGLTNGTAYTFVVCAVNAIGTGCSAESAEVTPMPPTVPDAPSVVVAYSGNGYSGDTEALIGGPLPDDGGSPILTYTVTPYVEGVAGTPFVIDADEYDPMTGYLVTGLTTDDVMTFEVAATNAIGTGDPTMSNEVTIGEAPPETEVFGLTAEVTG